MARQIVVELVGDNKKFDSTMQASTGKLNGFQSKFKSSVLAGVGLGAGLTAWSALQQGISMAVGAVGDAIKRLIELDRLGHQTEAVIRSTGGAANVTADHVRNYADAIEGVTGLQQENVQEGANMLLTFKDIRNEVGKGNNIFDQATDTMVDMSVALGQDMTQSALQLGKALNDPVRGITALRRVGVSFTDDQERMIRKMVETGDMVGAQKIILQELQSEFGQSSEEFANSTAGMLARFQNDWEESVESIVIGAVKVGDAVANAGTDMAMNFGTMGDRVHQIADLTGTDFTTLKHVIIAEMNASGKSFQEVTDAMVANALVAESGITENMTEGMRATHQVIVDKGAQIKAAWEPVAEFIPAAIRDRWDDMRSAAYQGQVEYAKGILDAQNQPKVAFDALLQLQEEEMDRAEEVAYLSGLAHDSRLQSGLQDGRPGVRNAAAGTLGEIISRLKELGPEGIRAANALTSSLASGISSGQWRVLDSVAGLTRSIRGYMPGSEPKNPQSPLRGITEAWGMMDVIAEGIDKNRQAVLDSFGSALPPMRSLRQSTAPVSEPAVAAKRVEVKIDLNVTSDGSVDERRLADMLTTSDFIGRLDHIVTVS